MWGSFPPTVAASGSFKVVNKGTNFLLRLLFVVGRHPGPYNVSATACLLETREFLAG